MLVQLLLYSIYNYTIHFSTYSEHYYLVLPNSLLFTFSSLHFTSEFLDLLELNTISQEI